MAIPNEQEQICEASEDQDTAIFVDDTTLSEVINITQHSSGSAISNAQRSVNNVFHFTKDERMELNGKKCKEMLIDFQKKITEIPLINIGDDKICRVKSYKLLE